MFFISIKNKILNAFKRVRDYFSVLEEGYVIAPCVGDIIEDANGERKIVVSVEIGDSGKIEVRAIEGITRVIGQRGKSRNTVMISKKCINWPPTNSKVIRDGLRVHPISEFRLSIVQIIDKALK
jgi:hypothetical protein